MCVRVMDLAQGPLPGPDMASNPKTHCINDTRTPGLSLLRQGEQREGFGASSEFKQKEHS